MKRIYLLLLLVAAAATNSFGRSVDLYIHHYIGNAGTSSTLNLVTNGTTVFSNGDTARNHSHVLYKFAYIVGVTSTSTDTLMTSDSLKFKTFTFGHLYATNNHCGKGDSLSFVIDSIYFNPGSFTTSGSKTWNYCDTISMTDNSGASVPDPNTANNTTCATVTFNYWGTGISNVEVEHNEAVLFPNPATKQLSLLYNFESGTKGAHVTITDAAGRVVLTQDLGNNLSGSQEIRLNNIATLSSGMYFLQLRTDEGKTAMTKFNIIAE